MFRLLRFGRQRHRIEPNQPHRFEEINDAGLAAAASGALALRGTDNLTQVVVADNYMRKSDCGVPGCGKPRHHPIHEAALE